MQFGHEITSKFQYVCFVLSKMLVTLFQLHNKGLYERSYFKHCIFKHLLIPSYRPLFYKANDYCHEHWRGIFVFFTSYSSVQGSEGSSSGQSHKIELKKTIPVNWRYSRLTWATADTIKNVVFWKFYILRKLEPLQL